MLFLIFPEFPPGEVVTSVVIGQTSLDQTYPDESVQRAWITVNPLYGDNQEDTDSLLPGHSIQSGNYFLCFKQIRSHVLFIILFFIVC